MGSNFRGRPVFEVFFADACDHIYLYNGAYFARLIFVDSSLSVKITKIGPLEIYHYQQS
jgi:hypothetical protein